MEPIGVDSNESYEIESILRQSVPTDRVPLNVHDYADYYWKGYGGLTHQIEHKQIEEILGGVDHVEEQLSREMQLTDRTYLLYTGTFKPKDNFYVQALHRRVGQKVLTPGRVFRGSYTGLIGWFDQLDRCGITVMQVDSEEDLPLAIIALYNGSQKAPEVHKTLRRYIKPRIDIKDKNPNVMALLSIGKTNRCGLGEDAARALVSRYGSLWMIINQSPQELAATDGVSLGVATKLLRAVGRVI